MKRIGFLKTVTLVVLFTMLLLTGCGSSSQRVEFYTLNPLTGMSAEANSPATDQKLSIGVGPVEIPEILDRPQIVTRSGPNKLNIDEFHRWAGPLDARFARVLAENIALLLATDRVAVYPWEIDFKPHYRIALDIRYFEGQLGENVLLDVVWRVSGQDSQMIQAVKTSVIKEPVSAPDYDALVAAKSEAITHLSRQIAQEIRKLQSGGKTD
jgi:uncharacterized lipoprotein YmbA